MRASLGPCGAISSIAVGCALLVRSMPRRRFVRASSRSSRRAECRSGDRPAWPITLQAREAGVQPIPRGAESGTPGSSLLRRASVTEPITPITRSPWPAIRSRVLFGIRLGVRSRARGRLERHPGADGVDQPALPDPTSHPIKKDFLGLRLRRRGAPAVVCRVHVLDECASVLRRARGMLRRDGSSRSVSFRRARA